MAEVEIFMILLALLGYLGEHFVEPIHVADNSIVVSAN